MILIQINTSTKTQIRLRNPPSPPQSPCPWSLMRVPFPPGSSLTCEHPKSTLTSYGLDHPPNGPKVENHSYTKLPDRRHFHLYSYPLYPSTLPFPPFAEQLPIASHRFALITPPRKAPLELEAALHSCRIIRPIQYYVPQLNSPNIEAPPNNNPRNTTWTLQRATIVHRGWHPLRCKTDLDFIILIPVQSVADLTSDRRILRTR